MTDSLIQAENLSKTYKTLVDEVKVFSGMNIHIDRGTAVAIIGESGRGKTTLLNILSGLDRPSTGKVVFHNQSISAMDESSLSDFRNHHVGFIFQHHFLLDDFTALDNILIPVRIMQGKITPDDNEKAMQLLKDVGMDTRATHYPDQLSGGERQRVAVVRALINNPDVIFADEPTGSLDKNNADKIEEIMWHLKSQYQKTLVIATHSMEMAEKCDTVIEMK